MVRARGHHHPGLEARWTIGPILVQALHEPGWLVEPEGVRHLDPELVAPALEAPPVAAVLEDDVVEHAQHGGRRSRLGHGSMVGTVPGVVLGWMARLARDRGREPFPHRLLRKALPQVLVHVRTPKKPRADYKQRADDEDDAVGALQGSRGHVVFVEGSGRAGFGIGSAHPRATPPRKTRELARHYPYRQGAHLLPLNHA